MALYVYCVVYVKKTKILIGQESELMGVSRVFEEHLKRFFQKGFKLVSKGFFNVCLLGTLNSLFVTCLLSYPCYLILAI